MTKKRLLLAIPTIEHVYALASKTTAIRQTDQQKQYTLPDINQSTNGILFNYIMMQGMLYEHRQLLKYLQTLTQRELIELKALFWLGRGDANFSDLLAHAEQSYSVFCVYYLVRKEDFSKNIKLVLDRITQQCTVKKHHRSNRLYYIFDQGYEIPKEVNVDRVKRYKLAFRKSFYQGSVGVGKYF